MDRQRYDFVAKGSKDRLNSSVKPQQQTQFQVSNSASKRIIPGPGTNLPPMGPSAVELQNNLVGVYKQPLMIEKFAYSGAGISMVSNADQQKQQRHSNVSDQRIT